MYPVWDFIFSQFDAKQQNRGIKYSQKTRDLQYSYAPGNDFNDHYYWISFCTADKKVLSVESKCYMPDKKSDLMNELTESYVWDYTFRIMCLYTDFIDRIIRWQGLVPLVTHNYPTGIGERSGHKSLKFNNLYSQ